MDKYLFLLEQTPLRVFGLFKEALGVSGFRLTLLTHLPHYKAFPAVDLFVFRARSKPQPRDCELKQPVHQVPLIIQPCSDQSLPYPTMCL